MNTETDAIAFMRDLDRRFQATSGLTDRRDYSIFYSRLQPARVMIIGIKPGGKRDGSHQLASPGFYEDWSHEYVDMHYRIAAVMRPTLMTALEAQSADDLRGVPKTNTFFQRAVGTDEFTTAELNRNVAQCSPFLAEMVAYVGPDVIIFEGVAARHNFVLHQCGAVDGDPDSIIRGMRFGRMSTFFQKEAAFVRPLKRQATLLTLGHPSHFGYLATWPEAVYALRANLGRAFLPPWGIDSHNHDPSHVRAPETSSSYSSKKAAKPPVVRVSASERFQAADRPPTSFRYSPIHDFWRELLNMGPQSTDEFYAHLNRIGWRRPSGKPLTTAIVRTDLVSMVKHGFAIRAQPKRSKSGS